MKCFIFTFLFPLLSLQSLSSAQTPPNGYEYMYINFGETAPQVLKPAERLANGDQFGKTVAIWDSAVAVSSFEAAYGFDADGHLGLRGKVSMFEVNYQLQWSDSGLSFTSGSIDDGFGTSVALFTNLMAIGAPLDSSSGKNRGKVYVYDGSPLALRAQLEPKEHMDDNDYFGHSVAIARGNSYYGHGSMIVVGAYGHNKDREKQDTGCVFVFAKNSDGYTWSEVGVVEPSVPVNHGGFGYSLSAFGNTLAVGSYGSDFVFLFELEGHDHGHKRQLRDSRLLQDEANNSELTDEWKYKEVLLLGLDKGEEHRPEEKDDINHFGASVAIYNSSGILTVAVGCAQCMSDGVRVGAVYLVTRLSRNNLVFGWNPEGHEQREEHEEPRRILGEHGDGEKDKEGEDRDREREGEDREREEREQEEVRRHLWNPEQETFESASHQVWYREAVFYGVSENERFGWSVAVDASSLAVGNNPMSYSKGEVSVYSRQKVSGGGPYFIVSGPLYNMVWAYASSLQDSAGVVGDKFGYSVAIQGPVAVVGSILSGLQDDGTFGAGAAYVYDRRYLRKIPSNKIGGGSTGSTGKGESNEEMLLEEMADSSTTLGATFVLFSSVIGFFFAMSAFYGAYRVTGGEKSPRELLLGTSGTRSTTKSSRPLRLVSALDDSTSSAASSSAGVVPGRGNTSAYSGLNTSSTHSTSSTGFKPRQQYVPKGPPKPTYTNPSLNRGRSAGRNNFKGGVDDI